MADSLEEVEGIQKAHEEKELDTLSEDNNEENWNKSNERRSKIKSKFYKNKTNHNPNIQTNVNNLNDSEVKSSVNTSVINSEEISGIAKIKSKLSLKVHIPDSKASENKSLESDPRKKEITLEKNNFIISNVNNINIQQDEGNLKLKPIDLELNFLRKSEDEQNNLIQADSNSNMIQNNCDVINFNISHNLEQSNIMSCKRILTPNITNFSPNRFYENNIFKNPMSSSFTQVPINNTNLSGHILPTIYRNNFNNMNSDSALISNKRDRDDNFLNFSPNLSAGNLRSSTPIYAGNMSPNISRIFMFNSGGNNSSFTPTPQPVKDNSINPINSISHKKKTSSETKRAFRYGLNKNEAIFEEKITNSNKSYDVNTGINYNTIVGNGYFNQQLPQMNSRNNNLTNNQFYSWVMQNAKNQNVKNLEKKKSSKMNKIKKIKYKDE